jgi:hypothetical protein
MSDVHADLPLFDRMGRHVLTRPGPGGPAYDSLNGRGGVNGGSVDAGTGPCVVCGKEVPCLLVGVPFALLVRPLTPARRPTRP